MSLLADWQHKTATLLPCHQHHTQLLWFWVTVLFLNSSLQIGSSQENLVCFDPRRIDDLELVFCPCLAFPACLAHCPPHVMSDWSFQQTVGNRRAHCFRGSGHRARVAGERGTELAAEPHCYLQRGLMFSIGAAMQTVSTLWSWVLKAFEGRE